MLKKPTVRQKLPLWQALTVAVAGASAVIFGAVGAHALHGMLDAVQARIWHTAVDYHFWHALALALVLIGVAPGRWRVAAAMGFILGMIMFSGSLYALALGAPRWIGFITPLGGLALIAGWIALGAALIRHRR